MNNLKYKFLRSKLDEDEATLIPLIEIASLFFRYNIIYDIYGN